MAFYTLYRRKNTKGAVVYYYRVTNPDGSRSVGHTTHEKTKAKANDFCQRLIQEGRLWAGNSSSFQAYADANHWFEWGKCVYILDKQGGGTEKKQGITESTALRYLQDLRLYLLPYFGKMKLKNIQPETVKKFRIWMREEKKLSNKTTNCAVATLRIMTEWALENNLIFFDPLRGIKPLKTDPKSRDAFMICEARRILKAKWKNKDVWLFNMTAAITGLRIAEVRALRRDVVFPLYLDVLAQYQRKLTPVKNQEVRAVPIPHRLYDLLQELRKENEFVFNFSISNINETLDLQMPPDVAAQKEDRNLSFHSWRHFFNTYLFTENISPVKVNFIIGHSSGAGSMADAYLHFTPEHYPEVYAAQDKLLDALLDGNPNL
jgi:integrase